MGLAEDYTPVWEPARPGHLYLDMTGSRRLFGLPSDTASRLAREVARRMGLASGVGVAQNKLVASVASKVAEEERVCEVLRGDEAAFLSPLGLYLLPGLGEKRLGVLGDWNVRSIGEFRSIPLPRLEEVFGRTAASLYERAAGIDASPVVPPGVEEKIVRARVLSFDEIDDELLLAHLSTLLEEGCRELRSLNKAARRLELSLRYSDGMESTRARTLKTPLFWEFELKPVARELFFELYSRRVRVRKLEIALGRLCTVPTQLGLFGDSPEKARLIKLRNAVDEIRDQFGFPLIGFASDLSALGSKDKEE
jgi:DNA polymerase-4